MSNAIKSLRSPGARRLARIVEALAKAFIEALVAADAEERAELAEQEERS